MLKLSIKYYNNLRIRSFNGIFNFVIGARNIGKTFSFKTVALRRHQKYKTVTIWVRNFRNEVSATMRNFYTDEHLKMLNVESWRIERLGNNLYYNWGTKEKKDLHLFIECIALSQKQTQRSVDRSNYDYIVFDEFTLEQHKQMHYRGNRANDFIDLFITKMRNNKIKCFFLGNKESTTNEFFTYFNIPILPFDFQGITTYNNHTIIVEYINDYVKRGTTYESNVMRALYDTPYYKYLHMGKTKNNVDTKLVERPSNATFYCQFYYENNIITYEIKKKYIYVVTDEKKNANIFSFDYHTNKNKNRYIFINRTHKNMFKMLEYGIINNNVLFCDYLSYDAHNYIVKKLGL